ncbi:hypothetical protein EMIHUDRAFT_110170 [Emiliania huxleyi CCMP1516]|uniref:Fumarylacetoacetase-like C-terminal domain-containing protein n=2 Tax=Emiliania huxleyi TaxID=2903 RepID=A0A0D3KL75_EMIH1|nr:hypothetical protein EMIHUDRAFT_110170 [Emiliania huxleyi CCMP1516]EOD36510.1 hypothetical protein EMIHUDRAFT_110170 [Emiliania huxleyi CCMP1516]|eukprot:XP_005788939.1 hypothetical protein EMIHUDRAFT_110170 [Emiliania huxleyi CCMP1516]
MPSLLRHRLGSLGSRSLSTLLPTSQRAQDAADAFVHAWVSGEPLSSERFPAAPASVDEMYQTHLAIQQHPLVSTKLGGLGDTRRAPSRQLCGYKLGAIGGAGQPCIYAPLFRNYLAPGAALSAAAIRLWQVEPEFAIVLGRDLPTQPDGRPHSVSDAWAAVHQACKRGRPEAYEASTKLGSYSDTLSSGDNLPRALCANRGGVVLGPRLDASALRIDDLRGAATLSVNGAPAAQGSGAAAPEGGPVEALAWLANHLNGRGLELRAGQLVATGQTCSTKAVRAGDRLRADFGRLGSLEMTVAP